MARSSHLRCSIKAAVIKSFAIFSVKHMCCGLFLIKLQTFTVSLPPPFCLGHLSVPNFEKGGLEKKISACGSVEGGGGGLGGQYPG